MGWCHPTRSSLAAGAPADNIRDSVVAAGLANKKILAWLRLCDAVAVVAAALPDHGTRVGCAGLLQDRGSVPWPGLLDPPQLTPAALRHRGAVPDIRLDDGDLGGTRAAGEEEFITRLSARRIRSRGRADIGALLCRRTIASSSLANEDAVRQAGRSAARLLNDSSHKLTPLPNVGDVPGSALSHVRKKIEGLASGRGRIVGVLRLGTAHTLRNADAVEGAPPPLENDRSRPDRILSDVDRVVVAILRDIGAIEGAKRGSRFNRDRDFIVAGIDLFDPGPAARAEALRHSREIVAELEHFD